MASVSHFFIDRPIFAAVVSIFITLTGAIALHGLPIAQYPPIAPPAIQVTVVYPGASAQVVSDTVAAPIEQQVNGVEGMLYMSSQMGNDGTYNLSVTFDVDADLNTALVMVQNRVSQAMPQLPTEVQQQGITIRKRTPDILLIVNFISPNGRYDDLYLSNFATINVRDELLRIEGVSDAIIFGQRDYSMRVWLDPQKTASLGINAGEVAAAIRQQNLDLPAGRIAQPPTSAQPAFDIPIDALARLTDVEQFGDIIVKTDSGSSPASSANAAATSLAASGSPLSSIGNSTQGGVGGVNMLNMPTALSAVLSSTVTSAAIANLAGTTFGGMAAVNANAVNNMAAIAGTGTTAASSVANQGIFAGGAIVGQPLVRGSSEEITDLSLDVASTDNAAMGEPPSETSLTNASRRPAVGIVRLRDIGRVELGALNYRQSMSFDGRPSVGIGVFQLPGTNALDVADHVREKMAELSKRFPSGVDYSIAFDTTPFIRDSVRDVFFTLLEASGLVGLVVLVFLQNWRSAIIPLITMPVAIVGAFAVMAVVGFSLNNISLFGLVLAIGIVVDDAIVVVENVERWIDRGMAPREATYRAMEEVTGPVVAVALVLCAVFVPCALVSGITGRFFRQFAVTIAASTVFSAINSLTLSPALSAILLRPRHAERPDLLTRLINLSLGWFFRLFNSCFAAATSIYVGFVGWLLRANPAALAAYAALLILTYTTFVAAPRGFVPQQDQGRIYVSVQLPDSASLQRAQAAIAQIGEIARECPGVAHVITLAGFSFVQQAYGPNFGSLFLTLDPFEKRTTPDLSDEAIMARLRPRWGREVKDAQVLAFGAPPIPGLSLAGGFKLMVEDRSGLGLTTLGQQTERLVRSLEKEPSLVGVSTQFRALTPQLYLDIDRAKAAALGVSLFDADQTLQIYLGSLYVNNLNLFGREWQVNVQAEGRFRNDIDDVHLLEVRNRQGQMVPFGSLTRVREVSGPIFINRYNLYTAAAITGSLRPGVSAGEVIRSVDAAADKTLALSMNTDWTELMYMQIRAGNTAIYVFALAVACVFLTLAALYESWSLPLAVILVVPLCALCSVWGAQHWNPGDNSVNIFVQIGLVVLVGLASKNSILIVEFARRLRVNGQSRREAAEDACRLRLRPILMTSLAFIFGVAPLIAAGGAGAEMRRSLGIAVFSGMLGVTAFGIFLTPVFFYVIQGLSEMRLFTAAASRWLVATLIGAALGMGIGFILSKMGFGGMWRTTLLGGAAGVAAALILQSLRRRNNKKQSIRRADDDNHDGGSR